MLPLPGPDGSAVTSEQLPVKIRNAAQAIDAVLACLRKQKTPVIPDAEAQWQEKTIYSGEPQDYAITGKLFTSDEWLIEVLQGVAPLSRTVYRISVFNPLQRYYWTGSVKADGVIEEEVALKELPEPEAQMIADEFLLKSKIPPPRPGGYGH